MKKTQYEFPQSLRKSLNVYCTMYMPRMASRSQLTPFPSTSVSTNMLQLRGAFFLARVSEEITHSNPISESPKRQLNRNPARGAPSIGR
jgi:hypothetical protein